MTQRFIFIKFVYILLIVWGISQTKNKMSSTPKRKNISLEEKYEIIQAKQKGMSTKEIAEKYGHSASTISTITNPANSKKVIDALQAGEVGSAKKRMRKLEYPDLDDAMDKWYEKTINTTNTIVDGPSMKRQAEKFAAMLGHTDFKASEGWLSKFKQRHNITFKTIVGETGFVSEIIVQDWNRRLVGIIEGYCIDDIMLEQLKQFYYSSPNDCCSEIARLQQMQDDLNQISSAKQASIVSYFKKA